MVGLTSKVQTLIVGLFAFDLCGREFASVIPLGVGLLLLVNPLSPVDGCTNFSVYCGTVLRGLSLVSPLFFGARPHART